MGVKTRSPIPFRSGGIPTPAQGCGLRCRPLEATAIFLPFTHAGAKTQFMHQGDGYLFHGNGGRMQVGDLLPAIKGLGTHHLMATLLQGGIKAFGPALLANRIAERRR